MVIRRDVYKLLRDVSHLDTNNKSDVAAADMLGYCYLNGKCMHVLFRGRTIKSRGV